MKITVETKVLKQWLSKIQNIIPEKNPAVGFIVREGHTLMLASSIESAVGSVGIVLIQIPEARCEETGEFYVTTKITPLLGGSRADEMTLTYQKQLSLRGDNNFRARLAVLEAESIPVAILSDIVQQEKIARLTLDSAGLNALIAISKSMPAQPPNNLRYICLHTDETGVWGEVQGSELGTVEYVPLGDPVEKGLPEPIMLNTDYIAHFSTLGGKQTVLEIPIERQNMVLLSDPDDSSWQVILARLMRI